jgi:competence CoiA-like predicted nuclease
VFSAFDSNNNLIDIDTAIQLPSDKYFCPSCYEELIIKDGDVRVKHFAHKSNKDCIDFDNDMSEWHRNWQKKFPLKNREVILKADEDNSFSENCNKITRRADVLCYGFALEFQNSPISSEEFAERNYFYHQLGKKVIWIFNLIDLYQDGMIECYDEWHNSKGDGGKYHWKYASKTFIRYKSFEDDVILFFQFNDISTDVEDAEQSYMERVTWAVNSTNDDEDTSFKNFFTSYYPSNFTELMAMLKREYYKTKM